MVFLERLAQTRPAAIATDEVLCADRLGLARGLDDADGCASLVGGLDDGLHLFQRHFDRVRRVVGHLKVLVGPGSRDALSVALHVPEEATFDKTLLQTERAIVLNLHIRGERLHAASTFDAALPIRARIPKRSLERRCAAVEKLGTQRLHVAQHLDGARLNSVRAPGRRGLGTLVDDEHVEPAEASQRGGEHQARRACADDGDIPRGAIDVRERIRVVVGAVGMVSARLSLLDHLARCRKLLRWHDDEEKCCVRVCLEGSSERASERYD